MTTLALYELADQYRALQRLAEQDDIPPEVIRDTLDALDGELRDKAVSVAHFIRNLETAAESIIEAAESMLVRARRLNSRAAALREYLLFQMQATQVTRVDSPYFVLAIRDNPPAVMIDDESQLPTEFMRAPDPPLPRPDRTRIAATLKAGNDVPGCRLIVRQRLDIRV